MSLPLQLCSACVAAGGVQVCLENVWVSLAVTLLAYAGLKFIDEVFAAGRRSRWNPDRKLLRLEAAVLDVGHGADRFRGARLCWLQGERPARLEPWPGIETLSLRTPSARHWTI